MRLRTSALAALAAGAATAAVTLALLLLGPPGSAAAEPASAPVTDSRAVEPYCGDPDSPRFPIKTRIRGGPDAYPPGGDWTTWDIELRNTTRADCRGIHPVAVFVDGRRVLAKEQIGLEFYDDRARKWRPAAFETTDQDEHIGVFDGHGFEGFTVKARSTLTVAVRMRFADGTGEGRVRVTVTTMQRRGDDGDWVGESNAYDFDIRRRAGQPGKGKGESEYGNGRGYGDGRQRERSDGPGPRDANARPLPAAESHELARTGKDASAWLVGAGGASVLGGAALVILSRRRGAR